MTPAELNLSWLPVGFLYQPHRFAYLGSIMRGPGRWVDHSGRRPRQIVVHRTTVRTRGSVGDPYQMIVAQAITEAAGYRTLPDIIRAASARFGARPLHRASVDARAELARGKRGRP